MARFLRRSLPTEVSLAFLKDFLMADEVAAIGTMVTAVSKRAAEEMPQEFARLSVPTLLVAGEFDQIIPAIMAEQAASLSKKVQKYSVSKHPTPKHPATAGKPTSTPLLF